MVNSEDRRIMAHLNRLPNLRDASGSAPAPEGPWKNPPTKINIPTNNGRPANRLQPGGNPFSNPIIGSSKMNKQGRIGNQTSSRTLVNSDLEPNKKRDPTFTQPYNYHNYSQTASYSKNDMYSNLQRSSVVSEQDIIVIADDDSDSLPGISAGVKRTYTERQSSDELNLKSNDSVSPPHQQSKYTLSKVNNKHMEEERNSGLAPDGQNTRRVEKKYGSKDDWDPIVSYDDDMIREAQRPETRASVGRLVQHFEKFEHPKEPPPKVDLTKLKSSKVKKMKPNGQSKSKFTPTLPTERTSKLQDPVATSTTLRRAPQQVLIPLARVCFEQCEFSGQELKAFFGEKVPLSIRDDDYEVFNLSSWPMASLEVEYTTGNANPTIQIKSHGDKSETRILTMGFLNETKEMQGKYIKLFQYLKKVVPQVGIVQRPEPLWQIAEAHCTQTTIEPGSSSTQGKERPLKRKKHSPSGIQPIPIKSITSNRHPSRASDPRDESSEGKGSRSTSKSRSNPPPVGSTVIPRRSTRNAPPEKPVDQDKVILIYPQGIPGAVNITNGDLARLQPGEYLNDTLIEFGLKLWLRQLEEKQPKVAQQVHIFNSFFYKKLNNKKNEIQAFETVRKWTSKFDIFQKKYIIVPINEHMHWYLAIIYEPEHVLSTPAPDETPQRKRTRLSIKVDPQESIFLSASEPPDALRSARSPTSSEAEVERNLDTDFQSSCNIDAVVVSDLDVLKTDTKIDDANDSSSDIYMPDPNDTLSRPQPPVNQNGNPPTENSKEAFLDSMDVDEPIDMQSTEKDDDVITAERSIASTSKSAFKGPAALGPIDPSNFYGSAKSKGRQRVKAKAKSVAMDVGEACNDVPKTYIFTFDSLGTNHPHAVKKLSQYLRMEAKDKKGIPNAGVATGKTAFVPVQPNFCDCGVYLLHFAQTFMTDPKKYFDLIMSQSKLVTNQEKQEKWNDKQVADMREDLSTRIQELSTVWMKERAVKEEEARVQLGSKDPDQIDVVSDNDSDIEIPPTPVKKSGRAARMRG